jgi:hypothetical protein
MLFWQNKKVTKNHSMTHIHFQILQSPDCSNDFDPSDVRGERNFDSLSSSHRLDQLQGQLSDKSTQTTQISSTANAKIQESQGVLSSLQTENEKFKTMLGSYKQATQQLLKKEENLMVCQDSALQF